MHIKTLAVNIYLDHAASTPLRREVLEVMMPWLTDNFGNASSVHARGRQARHAVEQARDSVARVLAVEPGDVVFTSGGTEANNQVINSHLSRHPEAGVVLSRVEHDALLGPVEAAERAGRRVIWLPADASAPGDMTAWLRDQGVRPGDLVCIMAVNNETGTRNTICKLEDVALHSDAVQAAAWYDLRPLATSCNYLTLSGHKLGGPKGAGAVVTSGRGGLDALIRGGGQERDRRSGTENVAAIVGFAKALALADQERSALSARVRRLREALWEALVSELGNRIRRITPTRHEQSAPHILHTVFLDADGRGLDGEMLILGLDMEGIQVSAGAACSSGSMKPSHVLTALGMEADVARGAVRFSLGRETTRSEIEATVSAACRVARRMA